MPERGDLAEEAGSPRRDDEDPREAATKPAAPAQGPREARPRTHENRS